MTISNIRSGLVSAVMGAILGLVVMGFVSTFVTRGVRASEEGTWTCPPHANPNCSWDTCFHNGTGGHECKYIRTDNTSNCSSSAQCEYKPWID